MESLSPYLFCMHDSLLEPTGEQLLLHAANLAVEDRAGLLRELTQQTRQDTVRELKRLVAELAPQVTEVMLEYNSDYSGASIAELQHHGKDIFKAGLAYDITARVGERALLLIVNEVSDGYSSREFIEDHGVIVNLTTGETRVGPNSRRLRGY
jgi:hypothetical protein